MNPVDHQPELPKPGECLGEFELLSTLGRGGFAMVYLARQERLDREVAVKVLMPNAVLKLPDLAQRFLREIDVVKRLEHPNVIRLYDFGQAENGLLWMAMELVRGQELGELLSADGRLAPQRAAHITRQVLSALSEAHELRLIHRDLKPGNIMLTRRGAERDLVKLLDFGVGKALGENDCAVEHNLTTDTGGTFGTPRYMAPEQLKNSETGAHTDVYASALILYEMLIGQAAVQGSTTYEVLVKQIAEPIRVPPKWKGTPLLKVLAKASEKEWRQRYPHALAFHDDFVQIDFSDARYVLSDMEAAAVDLFVPLPEAVSSSRIAGASKAGGSLGATGSLPKLSAFGQGLTTPTPHRLASPPAKPAPSANKPAPPAKPAANKFEPPGKPAPSANNLGEQAERPIDKKLGEQAERSIDKKLEEQAERPIDKKSALAEPSLAESETSFSQSVPTVPSAGVGEQIAEWEDADLELHSSTGSRHISRRFYLWLGVVALVLVLGAVFVLMKVGASSEQAEPRHDSESAASQLEQPPLPVKVEPDAQEPELELPAQPAFSREQVGEWGERMFLGVCLSAAGAQGKLKRKKHVSRPKDPFAIPHH
ncbi:MAG: serine/threonine-protein kinase [Myxococcota bacterium]|nr:serine/threonine-protein kinase [Myxococcota bacterium]